MMHQLLFQLNLVEMLLLIYLSCQQEIGGENRGTCSASGSAASRNHYQRLESKLHLEPAISTLLVAILLVIRNENAIQVKLKVILPLQKYICQNAFRSISLN